MKIDHEALGLAAPLPGGFPSAAADSLGEEVFPSAFGPLLNPGQPQPQEWHRLLRLDAAPASQLLIGPPPVPAGMDAMPGPSRRLQLRRLLLRHAPWLDGEPGASRDPFGPGGSDTVAGMLALLANYQDLEDAIVARQVAETRD